MGYTSKVIVEAEVFFDTPEETEEAKELREKAKAFGYKIEPIAEPANHAKLVSDWLRAHRDNIGYFVTVDVDMFTPEDGFIQLEEGESGKCYDLARDLKNFTSFLAKNGMRLEGRFYREGEAAGDVERFIVTNNKITGQEKAKLTFSDGTEYNG
jgi:hypothetical protein